MDAIIIILILKVLGIVHLSWLGAIGYGLLIDFILWVIYAALGE